MLQPKSETAEWYSKNHKVKSSSKWKETSEKAHVYVSYIKRVSCRPLCANFFAWSPVCSVNFGTSSVLVITNDTDLKRALRKCRGGWVLTMSPASYCLLHHRCLTEPPAFWVDGLHSFSSSSSLSLEAFFLSLCGKGKNDLLFHIAKNQQSIGFIVLFWHLSGQLEEVKRP